MEQVNGSREDVARKEVPVWSERVSAHSTDSREAIVFEHVEVSTSIGADHPARAVWSYVQHVDLAELYEPTTPEIAGPGQPPPGARMLLALWLYACIEGVGSARQLEHLSEVHHGFRWLRGGAPLSSDHLSDFRWRSAVAVDRLLTQGVAALWSEGLVSLASLSEDCIRIRVSGTSSSIRRLAMLERLLAEVAERVTRLRQEVDAAPQVSSQRLRAARERNLRRQ